MNRCQTEPKIGKDPKYSRKPEYTAFLPCFSKHCAPISYRNTKDLLGNSRTPPPSSPTITKILMSAAHVGFRGRLKKKEM